MYSSLQVNYKALLHIPPFTRSIMEQLASVEHSQLLCLSVKLHLSPPLVPRFGEAFTAKLRLRDDPRTKRKRVADAEVLCCSLTSLLHDFPHTNQVQN